MNGENFGSKDYVHRPEITLENLDVSKVDKNEIPADGKFYDGICIPLKFSDYDRVGWEFVWGWFNDQYVLDNGEDDTVEGQPIDLQLYIKDCESTNRRHYNLTAFIKLEDYDGGTYETKKINLSEQEENVVNFALLKLKNPEKYFLEYTRSQVANSQTVSGFGFVMDQIDEHDMYKSVWLSCDQKTCVIGCIQNVHQRDAKLQILKVG